MAIGWDQAWRVEVDEWISDQVLRLGRRQTGGSEPVRERSWSLVLRVPTDAQPIWFKAVGPGCTYEAPLTEALARWVGPAVLQPIAVESARGWLLTPDAGPTLRETLNGSSGQRHWERLLPRYAQLQIELSARVPDMLQLGVPDQRPEAIPAAFAALLADRDALLFDRDGGLTEQSYRRLDGMQPEVARWAAELAEFGIAPSVNHDDFHDANVLPRNGDYAIFDWGDASVAHPFATMLVTLNSIAHFNQLAAGSPELARLRDAYLEPWTADYRRAELVEAVRLATRTAKIGRALSWQRALVGGTAEEIAPYADAVPGWLTELFEPDLV